MENAKTKLEIENITKNYEGEPLLKGICFEVYSGEIFCLLGRSGSGKSTVLRIIAGLEKAESGMILWNGENVSNIPDYQRNFGLMFQDYALFPHMTVLENVAFGLQMQGIKKNIRQTMAEEALNLVNMGRFAKRSVTDLSGGEKQRVALARSLAAKPRLLMLDEPLAALDRNLRTDLQQELRDLLHKSGIPSIYVTHDQEEALTVGDRIAILEDGVIEQMGSPREVFETPKNRKVAEFLGMSNLISGRVVSIAPLRIHSTEGFFELQKEKNRRYFVGEEITLLLHSRGSQLGSHQTAENEITGKVWQCVFLGEDFKVTLITSGKNKFTFYLDEPIETESIVTIIIPSNSIKTLES